MTDPQPAESVTACLACAATPDRHLPAIGESVDKEALHLITRPGLYGLSLAPAGSRYAVLKGQIVRINMENGKLLSILRQTDRILD